MKKRFLTIISLALVLCSVLAMPALATDIDTPVEPIDPEAPYVDIDYYNCGCHVSSGGLAYCSSYAQTAHSTYTLYITTRLQRYENGYWRNYAGPWTSSGTHYCAAYGYYYVVPGYYYRAVSAVTVRNASGAYVESADLTSPTQYY